MNSSAVAVATEWEIGLSGPLADLLVAALVGMTLLLWWALFDILRRRTGEWPEPGPSRWIWALVVILVPLGAVFYLLAGPPARLGPRQRDS